MHSIVGRPKGPPTDKVGVRIPVDEITVWKQAASACGLSLNAFIQRAVRLEVPRALAAGMRIVVVGRPVKVGAKNGDRKDRGPARKQGKNRS